MMVRLRGTYGAPLSSTSYTTIEIVYAPVSLLKLALRSEAHFHKWGSIEIFLRGLNR